MKVGATKEGGTGLGWHSLSLSMITPSSKASSPTTRSSGRAISPEQFFMRRELVRQGGRVSRALLILTVFDRPRRIPGTCPTCTHRVWHWLQTFRTTLLLRRLHKKSMYSMGRELVDRSAGREGCCQPTRNHCRTQRVRGGGVWMHRVGARRKRVWQIVMTSSLLARAFDPAHQ